VRSVLTAIGMLFLLIVSACVDPCGNRILAETPSPDGRFKVVMFERDCGATTGFSTQVSIIPSGERLVTAPTMFRSTQRGNVFVADTNHGQAPSGPGGGPVVQVAWIGPTSLRITHDKRARVFSEARSVNGVAVEFKAE
jgi:hypothetical protein